MDTPLSILQIVQDDDIEKARELLVEMTDVNHLFNDQNNKPLSAAWVAGWFGARKVLAFLVKAGADLDFVANGVAVRRLGMRNRDTLLALIEGGLAPDSIYLYLLISSGHENGIPRSNLTESILMFLKANEEIADDDHQIDLSILPDTPYFKTMLPDYEETVALSSRGGGVDFEALQLQIEDGIRGIGETFARIIKFALFIASQHPNAVDDAIISNFRGFRKNKKWLMDAANKSTMTLAEKFAPILNMYEDDDELISAIHLVLSTFPVEERLRGLPSSQAQTASWINFEKDCADALQSVGFQVSQVGASGDQGADIIAELNGISFAIQCKQYSSAVGNAAVQQALSAKSFYGTDYAVVCAPNGFTKSAKSLASSAGVILLPPSLLPDLEKLRALVD
jgi:hypothetical protein